MSSDTSQKEEYEKNNDNVVEEEEEENNEEENVEQNQSVQLQLGDVIHIISPRNENLNDITFIIDYIDQSLIKLINTENLNPSILKIKDGVLGDGTITSIELMYRNEKMGYARQNDLLPGIWINIYFGGDIPLLITGEITNLEEDMIEIKTYPEGEILYINFAYKGIPEDLDINTIEIREKPIIQREEEPEFPIDEFGELDLQNAELEQEEQDSEDEYEEKFVTLPPKDDNQLREFIIKANDIHFGEELGSVAQMINVEDSQQRYTIDTQTNDLLDQLLANIPTNQRTTQVLNSIHILIERFKQLRTHFSEFDENKNVVSALINDSNWKPLINDLFNFNSILYWILPVAKNVKKMYNVNTNEDSENQDIDPINLMYDLSAMVTCINNYKSDNSPQELNKYVTLMNELNPYLTPFQDVNPESVYDILYETNVLNNLNVVIDNLGDLYSSVFERGDIKNRRFLIQKYNLGLTKLETTQMSGSRMIAHPVNLTPPDILSLKSIITLPEPAIQFSHVNLPATNILVKSNLNLNFINYWEMLKKSTSVNNISVDNLEKELEFTDETYVNNIKNYNLLRNDVNIEMTPVQKYRKFLNVIVPKTKVLFNLIKKYIKGKLSFVEVVGFLEPFLIYTDDITYMQYKEIISFLELKISEYNKNFIERSKIFTQFKRLNTYSKPVTASIIIKLLNDGKFKSEVLDSYNNNKLQFSTSNSELLKKMSSIDFANLYNNAVAIENLYLMIPENIASFIEKEEENLIKKGEIESEKNKCVKYTIAKQYKTLEELERDNNKEIYFDKKFDHTIYSILDNYEKEQIQMKPDEFKIFITNKLITKHDFSVEDADHMAETLINGVKRVLENDIAIIYLLQGEQDIIKYFRRKNNIWVLDEALTENNFSNNDDVLCNLQEDCIEVDKKYKSTCESLGLNKTSLTQNALKDMLKSFDKKYYIQKQLLEENLIKKYNYDLKVIEKLIQIENFHI